MQLKNVLKELAKYLVFRCSRTAMQHYHRDFDVPSRHYMESQILPAVSTQTGSRVLFVGCRSYTYHYRNYFQQGGIDYWTSDIDPAAKIWGERRQHITCDIRRLDQHVPSRFFDLVMLNGVFGWGVDDVPSMDRTISSIHRVLKDGGHLLIGWNKDRVPDPQLLPAIAAQFDRSISLPLPVRKEFEDYSHIYDLFRAKPITPACTKDYT